MERAFSHFIQMAENKALYRLDCDAFTCEDRHWFTCEDRHWRPRQFIFNPSLITLHHVQFLTCMGCFNEWSKMFHDYYVYMAKATRGERRKMQFRLYLREEK
jgi:hypothetical protein